MMMDVLVFSDAEIASEEEGFDALEKRGVGRHHINELAVLRASLAHYNLAVLFDRCFESPLILNKRDGSLLSVS